VLARAVVVQASGRQSRLVEQPHTTSREWLVRSAREITLLEPDRLEHSRCELDVLRFAAVRSARECELLAPPPARVEATRFDEREQLKRLCAGAPDRRKRRIARAAEQSSIGAADDCVHTVTGFDRVSARGDDVQIKVIR
jgi:hypothetical protein